MNKDEKSGETFVAAEPEKNASEEKKQFREFLRLREELSQKLSAKQMDVEFAAQKPREFLQEADFFREFLTEKLAELETLNEDNVVSLTDAAKQVESIRLEFLRCNGRFERVPAPGVTPVSSSSGLFVPELLSLSFLQLFRIGTAFLLPVMAAIVVGSIILALGYIIAVQG